jgi:zinc protease
LGIRFGDPKSAFGKSAEAQMAGALLMRGTKNKSRQQIQDESDRLKAQINVSGNATGANANIQTVEANLAGALRLAAELLREPSFPENEFEQVRQQRLAGIENARASPKRSDPSSWNATRPYERGDAPYVSTLTNKSRAER